MPRHAINTGLVDIIAPAQQLPEKILTYLQHPPAISRVKFTLFECEHNALEKMLLLLRAHTGHDFSLYKKATVCRRIERRMGLHHLDRIGDYIRYLRERPEEVQLLFKELLIGVTYFFRDTLVWEQLKNDLMPSLITACPDDGVLRAWVPGCSTGEEAYSLAMIFKEALEEIHTPRGLSLQIFATDLDKEAVHKARQGFYPSSIAAAVSEQRLSRFFLEEEQGYRVKKEIREMLVFAPQNLIMDPPFTKIDLISCRNLLIYLETPLQDKLFSLFHYSLNPSGILLLGSAETVRTASRLFTSLSRKKTRFYRRRELLSEEEPLQFSTLPLKLNPPDVWRSKVEVASNLQVLIERLLLQFYTPAAVLVSVQGDIIYISGKTGNYLEPAVGKANLNLFAMARDGLSAVLTEIFSRVLREQVPLTYKAIKVGTYLLDVIVRPITEPGSLQGKVLVVFKEVESFIAENISGKATGPAKIRNKRLTALTTELAHCYESLQISREEMQVVQEDLKSTTEELQSNNEELLSMNEELTTSKEEMQSLNEELQTINNELQSKLDELSRTSDDMHNLLNSTNIATLFLDESLCVRRFTTEAASIIQLIPTDVGRPITDLVTRMDYFTLADDAKEVLNNLALKEIEVSTKDGHWFIVRIMPYRTQENRIAGVVITFTDVSKIKETEAMLKHAQTMLQERLVGQKLELDKANTIWNAQIELV